MEAKDTKRALLLENARKIYDLALIKCGTDDDAKAVTERVLRQMAHEFDSRGRTDYTNNQLDSLVSWHAAHIKEADAPDEGGGHTVLLTLLFIVLLLLFGAALIFAYELMAERGIIEVSFRFGFLGWFSENIYPVI